MFVFVRFWLIKFKLLLLQEKAATASEKSSTCFREKLLLLLEKAVPALKTSSSSVSRVSYCLIYETMNKVLNIRSKDGVVSHVCLIFSPPCVSLYKPLTSRIHKRLLINCFRER